MIRSLQFITEAVSGQLSAESINALQVYGVSTDSRSVQQGNLFIPLDIGNQFDGHNFVTAAFAKGATASLWQRDRTDPPSGYPLIYVEDTLIALQQLAKAYRSQLSVRVIGITGSNGKTTTKDLVASILETTYRVHKTKGNLNNQIGLPMTLLQLAEDTEMAVIEMGMSERGEIKLLSDIAQPDVAIITNIGESHLMQLGSREEIARAKLEIVSGLKENGLFVYNGDEPLIERMMTEIPHPANRLQYRYGFSPNNDSYPAAIMLEEEGTFFQLNRVNSLNFFMPLLGKHNVINALAAIAVGKFMGVCEEDIVKGLRSLTITSMRTERVPAASGAMILNDAYNASPTSMRAGIDLLSELKGYRRKIVVLGDMLELGEDEIRFHQEIGHLLSPRSIDLIFAYGSLARHIAEAAETNFAKSQVKWYSDKTMLIRDLTAVVTVGDLVLVKGSRGMKLEEIVFALKDGEV